MKTLFFFILMAGFAAPAVAQQPLTYTIWADGLVNPQLAKSSFYLLGTGLRGEISKPIGNTANALFAQVGYGHFFQKSTSAFVANIGLVTIGYRYQSRKAFTASVGIGAQYWREQMRVSFPDDPIDETVNTFLPSATVGIGFRMTSRYRISLENRVLVKPESGSVLLCNTIALSVSYTL